MSDFDDIDLPEEPPKPKGTGQFPKKRGESPAPDPLDDPEIPVEERVAKARDQALGKIDKLADEPLITTGKTPSPEAVAEAKRIVEEGAEAQAEMLEAAKTGAITTAAAMLPSEEEETPPPPEASEPPPPGEPHGPFLVQKTPGYGDGWRVLVETPSGAYVPVGIWLHEEHPALDRDGVRTLLTGMGLPAERAEAFARHRSYARPVEETLREAWGNEAYEGSAFAQATEEEERHWQTKDSFSRAFIEAQRKKEKR